MSSPSPQSKLGIVIPNRIFVGGLSSSTTETDLLALFENYGRVKATKIIFDRSGISRGYGFVTFETREEADKVLRDLGKPTGGVSIGERKLNIAPAVKKTQGSTGEHSGFMSTRDTVYPTYPVMLPPAMYISPYQYPGALAATGSFQHLYPSEYYAMGYSPQVQFSTLDDFRESPAVGSPPEGGKQYQKHSSLPSSSGSDYESSPQAKSCHPSALGAYRFSSGSSTPSPVHPQSYQLHQLFQPKTGMAIMAYPSSIVVGTPIVHVKEAGSSEAEAITTELGFFHSPMHSPITAGALTPPPTPLASFPCDLNSNSSIEASRKN